MKSKATISLIIIIFFVVSANSQIIDCTPDPDCNEVIPNNGMICPDHLPDAVEGEHYEETITIIPISQLFMYHIHSVVLDSVGNVPEGLEWGKCSEVFLVTDPFTRYCLSVYGTPAQAGDYHIKLYVTPFIFDNGYIVEMPQQVDDTSFVITVLPAFEPVIADFTSNVTEVTEGEYVNFTDLTEGNPTFWKWFFEGGVPETSLDQHPQNIQYPNGDNCYDVKLIAGNDFDSDTITKHNYICVDEIFVDIYKNIVREIQIFPNPAENDISVSTNEIILKIELFDSKGRAIMTVKPESNFSKIDISTFSKGNYFLNISTESSNYTKPFVIQ